MLGPAIAGVVVATAGAPAALFIDAASFLICGAMLLDLYPHAEEAAGTSVRERLRAAWQYVNSVPLLRALLIAETIALVFFNSADPIEIAYAKVTLHAGDRGFGLLLAVWGVGVVVGSLVFARSPKRGLGTMLTAGTLAMGFAYIGFRGGRLAPGRVCGRRDRWIGQRRRVGLRDQSRAAADTAGVAWPSDERSRIDRGAVACAGPDARGRAGRAQLAPWRVSGSRHRGYCDDVRVS